MNGGLGPLADQDSEGAEAQLVLSHVSRQTALMEEIRNQFAEHLELQRMILRLLMAERGD